MWLFSLVTRSQCFQVCAVVHGHGAEGLRPENSPPRGSSWRFDTTTRSFSFSICLSASKSNSQIVHVGHKVELESKPTNQSSYSAGLEGKFLWCSKLIMDDSNWCRLHNSNICPFRTHGGGALPAGRLQGEPGAQRQVGPHAVLTINCIHEINECGGIYAEFQQCSDRCCELTWLHFIRLLPPPPRHLPNQSEGRAHLSIIKLCSSS